ncbi:MAG: Omp28-related outer membrane protein [Flavobacteriales bacterium]
MKKVFAILIIGAVFCQVACDKVEDPIEAPTITVVDSTTVFPEIDTLNINIATQKVLVEEFTGVKCQGCPTQTEKLLALQENNKPEIIAIAYHEGVFAEIGSDPDYESDFTTDYGDAVHAPILGDLEGYPSVMVNRKTFPDEANKYTFLASNQWESPITKSIGQPSTIALGVAANYVESKALLKIRVSAKATAAISSERKLIVLCIEDSVVAEQKDQRLDQDVYPHRINHEYVHRHLLRAQVNSSSGITGDVLIDASGLAKDEWIDWTQDFIIPETVEHAKHIIIVAFVLDPSNGEVQQVEEAHVVKVAE